MPDYTLMTEVQSFQAEPIGPEAEPLAIQIVLMATIIRESDRQIIGARRFAGSVAVAFDQTEVIVAGFDIALRTVLQEAVRWTTSLAR